MPVRAGAGSSPGPPAPARRRGGCRARLGCGSTIPRSPSTMMGRSGDTASHRPGMPTTAGSPKERAMIDAWDVGPPRSSASARTRRGSRREASTGESSSATRIEPRGRSRGPGRSPSERCGRDLARHVRDVRLALAQRRRVGRREAGPEFARDLGQRPLGVDPVAPDALDDAAQVRLVERDQAVRLQDRGELGAHVALGLTGVSRELFGGPRGRAAQAAFLFLELLGGDRAAERRKPAEPDDHGPPDGQARRNGEALEHLRSVNRDL